jgi:hypothetical protein
MFKKKRNVVQSLFANVRGFFADQNVAETIRLGSEVFNAAQSFVESPSLFNLAKGTFNVAKTISDRERWYRDEYFDNEADWLEGYSRDFNEVIKSALSGFPFKMIADKADKQIKIIDLGDGCKVGWTIKTNVANYCGHVHVSAQTYEETRKKIKKLLWGYFEEKSIVLRKSKHGGVDAYGNTSHVSFEHDVLYTPMASERATQYTAYIKRFMNVGIPRSVLLYGPPGTGKSTMATTIVDALGMRSFRIRVSDLGSIQGTTLFEAINIFEPEVIILDDFDRADNQEELLETLEFFQKRVKLVIATANHKDALDDAILRPGRFDELLEIKKLDQDAIKNILGPQHMHAFDDVKDWPVAYVQEYVKRATFMSAEEAKLTVLELKKRVDKLVLKYSDDDELDVDA